MRPLSPWAIALAVLIAGCSRAPEPTVKTTPAAPPAAAIEWIKPQSVADVDRAFELAKARKQPVFLYWTAVWCPPCNQVKSTIFTRPDFIEKSREFVPLYVDADSPSGQALGQRFNVSFYPTMVLLDVERKELTRLSGSVDAVKYMQLLDRGLAGGNSARQALDTALAGRPLPAEDWHMLAFYSWETDDGQLAPEKDLPATLLKLAAACPVEQREASARLVLHALWSTALAKDAKPTLDKADAIGSLTSLLSQPQLVRDNNDLLGWGADDIVGLLTTPGSKQRTELIAQWNAALDRLSADTSLTNNGRMYALLGKVSLARLDKKDGALPAALVEEVRTQAARVDRETTDQDERQAVITLTGAVLARAGLIDESDSLLKAEIPRSHSSYYYMSQLASNAKRRGTSEGTASAIDWSLQAYKDAQGSATRLRWGGSYVAVLIDLAPQDAAAIEKATMQVINEADPDALTGNNRAGLQRVSRRLVAWNQGGKHDDVLARLHASMTAKCSAQTQRAWCDELFAPAKRA
jgi:thiol-disulfide isomerase/thioredoxin